MSKSKDHEMVEVEVILINDSSGEDEDFVIEKQQPVKEEELSITSVQDSQTFMNHNDDDIEEDLNSDQEEDSQTFVNHNDDNIDEDLNSDQEDDSQSFVNHNGDDIDEDLNSDQEEDRMNHNDDDTDEDLNSDQEELYDESTENDGYESPIDDQITYYKNKHSIPILKKAKCKFTPQTVIDLLLKKKSQRISVKKPVGVQDNMAFLIDTKKLKNEKDWAADDNGSWINNSNNGTIVSLDKNMEIVTSRRMPRRKKDRKMQESELLIYKVYYKNKSSNDFHRDATVIQTHDEKQIGLLLLEYW